jgi:hypothetical protein
METPYVSGGRLSKAASQMSTPLHRIVDQLLAELSAELEPEGRDHIIELSYIVSSALGLAAETFCKDEIDTIFETLVGMRAGLWRSQAVRIEPGKRRCDVKAVGM